MIGLEDHISKDYRPLIALILHLLETEHGITFNRDQNKSAESSGNPPFPSKRGVELCLEIISFSHSRPAYRPPFLLV